MKLKVKYSRLVYSHKKILKELSKSNLTLRELQTLLTEDADNWVNPDKIQEYLKRLIQLDLVASNKEIIKQYSITGMGTAFLTFAQ